MPPASQAAGALYVIATPIGNLDDLTPRAAQLLAQCDAIYAEDTRRTRTLLSHLEVHGIPLHALHAHSPPHALARALERVQQGSKVGLVSDAGTPAVSDPGSELVRACHRAGLRVVAIPGASAVTTAVCASGLVEGPFLFLGFLPRRGSDRAALLKRICDSSEPCIIFESPLRVQATLRELAQLIPEREACVARELSKLHEEVRVASLQELAEQAQWRGECTLVISGSTAVAQPAEPPDEDLLRTEIATALAAGASTKALADALAERLGRPRKEMYSLVLQMREPARERSAKAR